MSVVPAVVVAGLDAGGNIVSNIGNYFIARENREWQEKMWNKQNEYNLPVNQVARLKEAGINPNTAFGSASSTMSAAIPGSPSLPRFDFNLGSAARTYFQYKYERESILSQIRERNADTRRKELDNDILASLIEEKRNAMKWGFLHDARRESFLYNNANTWYGAELNQRVFNEDVARYRGELYKAQRDLTVENYYKAIREYEHLKAKYGFEDAYYNNGLNPYETSTVAGAIRTIGGLTGSAFGVPGFTLSDAHRTAWRSWRDFRKSGKSMGEYVRELNRIKKKH